MALLPLLYALGFIKKKKKTWLIYRLCCKIGIYLTTEFDNLHRKLPTVRWWDYDRFDSRLDMWKIPCCVSSWLLSLFFSQHTHIKNFDSTYKWNKPNCFVLWEITRGRIGEQESWPVFPDRWLDWWLREKMYVLKRRMNYDSFHIKKTYLRQRALRTPSTSTDAITNWPANHLPLASKVQIRYLRSLKEDPTVCSSPSLLLSEPCFTLN